MWTCWTRCAPARGEAARRAWPSAGGSGAWRATRAAHLRGGLGELGGEPEEAQLGGAVDEALPLPREQVEHVVRAALLAPDRIELAAERLAARAVAARQRGREGARMAVPRERARHPTARADEAPPPRRPRDHVPALGQVGRHVHHPLCGHERGRGRVRLAALPATAAAAAPPAALLRALRLHTLGRVLPGRLLHAIHLDDYRRLLVGWRCRQATVQQLRREIVRRLCLRRHRATGGGPRRHGALDAALLLAGEDVGSAAKLVLRLGRARLDVRGRALHAAGRLREQRQPRASPQCAVARWPSRARGRVRAAWTRGHSFPPQPALCD